MVTTPSRVAAEDIADRLDSGCAVIVVDRFEEAFTALEEPTRTKMFDTLVDAVPRGHQVVLTLRSDFFGACAAHQDLSDLVAANTVLVGPMSAHDLRNSVERPAHLAGLTLEHGLVERIIAELGGAPGALPLLSTALRSLWEARRGRELTAEAYERSGRVTAAVERLGESAYERQAPSWLSTSVRQPRSASGLSSAAVGCSRRGRCQRVLSNDLASEIEVSRHC